MIEEKLIYSGLGILFGWLLKEINTHGARHFDRKQKLGHAIASLMSFNREVILLRANLEEWHSQNSSAESYERIRQHVTSRINNRKGYLANSLDEALKTVSLYYPLEAEKLDHTITGIKFQNTIKLNESAKVKELYLAQLSILEVGIDLAIESLSKSLKKLACKHGIVTWYRVYNQLNKLNKTGLSKPVTPILDPMFDELNKIKQKAQPQVQEGLAGTGVAQGNSES